MYEPAGKALSALSELVSACESLPDLDTIQIFCLPTLVSYKILPCKREKYSCSVLCRGKLELSLKEEAKGMKDFVIGHLMKSKAGRQEGEGRRITVRVIRFSSVARSTYPPSNYPGDSVEVEEHKV